MSSTALSLQSPSRRASSCWRAVGEPVLAARVVDVADAVRDEVEQRRDPGLARRLSAREARRQRAHLVVGDGEALDGPRVPGPEVAPVLVGRAHERRRDSARVGGERLVRDDDGVLPDEAGRVPVAVVALLRSGLPCRTSR